MKKIDGSGIMGDVELQQLRYVVAVAEEGSFTRAAKRCFVVQSALSHQIKALESEIGVRLFARTSRRVALTPAGEAFLDSARATLAAAERAITAAVAATGRIRGPLRIGTIPTVTAIDLPALLGSFHRRHPEVGISLRHSDSARSITAIAEGRLDVAVLGLAEASAPTGVRTRVLAREQLVAVLPATHPLARRRRLRLTELAEEPFVDFPLGSAGREQSDLAFEAAGLDREVTFEAMGTELLLGLVRVGLVVAMLPAAVVPDDPGLRVLPVTGAPTRIQYLAWSAFNPSPAAGAFVELVTDPG